jgi:hypothetical protein
VTSEEHNRYLAWAFIAHGGFQLFVLLLMMSVFGLVFAIPSEPGGPPAGFFIVLFGFIFLFQTLFAVPSFVAAYSLFKRKRWARIASILAGVLSAMNVPIGTAVCGYALWFFLGDRWKDVYRDGFGAQTGAALLNQAPEARWSGYHTNERGEVIFTPVEPPDWR